MYLFILSRMRKYVISALFVLFLGGYALGQDYQIGIKVAPTLSNSRTSAESSGTSLQRDGSAVKFLLGAFVDIPFKANYYFSGGVNFASKVTKLTLNTQTTSLAEEYDHEFLQIPLLLKLYTNEVTLDTKVFFNFGVVPEIRLNSSTESDTGLIINDFQDFDLAGNFGAGVERGIGVNTRVFAALNYNIGFINMVATQVSTFGDIAVKSNLFTLEFVIKF